MSLTILGGAFKGRKIQSPKGTQTRPTQSITKAAVFNICASEIENASFLDLYAGSGAMGFEALSRGAQFSVFVESHPLATRCIRENQKNLDVDTCQLISKPVERFLQAPERFLIPNIAPFHIIYLDPPYGLKIEELDLSPLLAEEALVFLEERKHKGKAPSFPCLTLLNSRTFGETLLHTYRALSKIEKTDS